MGSLSRETRLQLVASVLMWLVQPQFIVAYLTGFTGTLLSMYDGMPKAIVFGIALWTFAGGLILARRFWSWRPIEARQSKTESSSARIPVSSADLVPAPIPVHQAVPSETTIVTGGPEYLIDLFAEHTDMQGQNLVKPYIGKWMRVLGSFDDLSLLEKSAKVSIRNDNYKSFHLFLWFDAKWVERLSVLRPGETVTAIGKIEEVYRSSVRLKNCELES